MHEILVNRLGGLSLLRKRNSVVRLGDRPDRTLDFYRGRKTTTQQLDGLERVHDLFVKSDFCYNTSATRYNFCGESLMT